MNYLKTVFYITIIALIGFTGCKSGQEITTSAGKKGQVKGKELNYYEKMKFESLFFDANKEKVLGNNELAASLFKKCLDIDPHNTAALYELARIYSMKLRDGDAMTLIKRAIEIEPENKWYLLLYSEILKNNRKYEEYAKVWSKLVEISPNNIEYSWEYANALLYVGKNEDAISVYNQLEEKMGIMEEVSVQKQAIYNSIGKKEEAINEVQRLVNAYPEETRYYHKLAQAYLNNNMEQKALETYEKVREIDPENPEVHLFLSDYYRQKGDHEKAFDELKAAFTSARLDVDTKVKILLSLYTFDGSEENLKGQGLELCRALIETHPKEAKSYTIYGDFLYRDQKLEEARSQFRKAIELDESRYPIWNQLLVINSQLSDFKAMEQESEQALELFPNQPAVYLFNGIAKSQNKKYNEAIEILETGISYVIENNPLKAQFYSNLGDAYNSIREYSKSDENFDKALELQPEDTYVLNNYSYYLSLRGEKLEKAAEMSELSNRLLPNTPSFQDTYAWILYQQGKYDEAKEWLEKAFTNGGDSNSEILEHYGDVMFKLNKVSEAIEYWEKAKNAGGGSDLLEKKIANRQLYE